MHEGVEKTIHTINLKTENCLVFIPLEVALLTILISYLINTNIKIKVGKGSKATTVQK